MRKETNGSTNYSVMENKEYSNFFDNVDGYNFFVKKMKQAARNNNLPLMLEHNDPMKVSMCDIRGFSQSFKKDTGLDIDFRVGTCDNCDRLHFYMIVDYKE